MTNLKLVAATLLTAVGLASVGAMALATQAAGDDGPQVQTEAQATPRSSENAETDRRWIKTLSNGGTIEVIAVSTHPSGPHTWWRPDGTPLDQPPCDPAKIELKPSETAVARVIVARVSNLPQDANQTWWISKSQGGSTGAEARLDGKPIPGMKVAVTEILKGQATTTIQFSAATGTWQTVATLDRHPMAVGSSSPAWPGYMSSGPISSSQGTALVVTHQIPDAATQVVAVDRQGQEHASLRKGSVSANGVSQLTAEFNLGPDSIQNYRLQKRPYERIEIPEIAVNPIQPE